jgi:hypothetical protein
MLSRRLLLSLYRNCYFSAAAAAAAAPVPCTNHKTHRHYHDTFAALLL